MLSSWQIAQIHASQGQQFAGQQAFSQQLSMRMPQQYQGYGLGATGMGQGGFGPQGYNYGGGWGSGYGPGNSFGNSMTSAIGGVGNAVGGVMKFGGSLAGGIVGGMFGGPVGAAVGSFAGGLAGGAIQHVAGSFMEGAHEQSAIERTLSQFQFQNAGSRTGRGFNRSDSMAIGNMVRQMERIPEMLTSFGELNRLMDKMGQMGLMQGVRDAGEFMRKFRDTTATLKDLAKVMGTTMEGALQAFGEARMSGFYSKGDITRNVLNRQITSSITGMNQSQIGGLQAYGAEMAHSLGGSRAGGARNMLRTAGQLGMANQMGILTNDQIMEMTGKEGAAGLEELSGQMSALSYKMGNSNVGQALTLALGKMSNGRYTGEMDQELVERVRRGELGLDELKSMARSKASTRGAKLSFAAHKNRLRTEMAGAVGSEGISMQLQEILGERGWQNPDATNLVMQRFGASEEQANLLQKMMPNLQGIGSQIALAGKNEQRNVAMNSAMAEHGWDAIKHRIGKKISHYTTDWAKDIGRGVRDYFQNWADDFLDDLSGRYTTYVTKRVADAVKFNSAGLSKMASSTAEVNRLVGGMRMDVGASGGFSGLLARGAHYFGGGTTQGENLDYVMHNALGGRMLHHQGGGVLAGLGKIGSIGGIGGLMPSSAEMAAARGNVVLDSSWTGRASFTSASEMDRVRQALSSGSFGQDQLKSLKGVLSDRELQGLTSSFQDIMMSGEASQETDMTKRAQLIYQKLREKNRSGLNQGQILAERSGRVAITALGKARQKAGLGELDIVAALQQSAGGNFRGGVDFRGLMGDVDLTNQKSISDSLKNLDRRFQDMGDEGKTTWSEFKTMMDQGGEMSQIALAVLDEKRSDFLGQYNPAMADKKVRLALSKDPSTWGKAEMDALKARGIDPTKLAAKMATPEGQKEVDRLLSLVNSGKLTFSDAQNYLRFKDASGLNEVASRFRSRGLNMKDKLQGGAADALKGTKEGQEVLRLMGQQADALSGIKSGADLAANKFQDTGELAAAVENLKDPSQKAAAMAIGGPELQAVMSYRKQLKGRGGLRTGMGIEEVLKASGMEGLGFEGAEGEFRKKLEGALGKDKKLDKGELEQVVKMLVDVKSKGLSSTPGDKAGSTQVSEQDIAKSLATMSENNRQATQILANLAAGKTGKDAMEGVSSK